MGTAVAVTLSCLTVSNRLIFRIPVEDPMVVPELLSPSTPSTLQRTVSLTLFCTVAIKVVSLPACSSLTDLTMVTTGVTSLEVLSATVLMVVDAL